MLLRCKMLGAFRVNAASRNPTRVVDLVAKFLGSCHGMDVIFFQSSHAMVFNLKTVAFTV